MTSIDTMEAGKALDRLVAERVMGYSVYVHDKGYKKARFYQLVDADGIPVAYHHMSEDKAWEDCPRFSMDIAPAWRVVEAMRAKGYWVLLEDYDDGSYGVSFVLRAAILRPGFEAPDNSIAPTAPLAICRAALAALESEGK